MNRKENITFKNDFFQKHQTINNQGNVIIEETTFSQGWL